MKEMETEITFFDCKQEFLFGKSYTLYCSFKLNKGLQILLWINESEFNFMQSEKMDQHYFDEILQI